jgi:hypothetical protein
MRRVGITVFCLLAALRVDALAETTAATETGFQRGLKRFLERPVDVLTVTDVTKEGKALTPATPANPVRCQVVYYGYTHFDGTRTWANESIPPNRDVLKWLLAAMQQQGYLVADDNHPPEQLLVISWGMMAGDRSRQALGFLGGDKVNLMWEQTQYGGFVDAKVLLRGILRTGVASKVWDYSGSNLFVGVVRSYTMNSLEAPKTTLLWETRFACPAAGLAMDEAMPLMVKAAAVNLGRETARPVTLDATREFGGSVTIPDFEVLGEVEDISEPQLDRPKDEETK